MGRVDSESIQEAKRILEGVKAADAAETKALAKRLKEEKAFGYARRVLARARKASIEDPKLATWIRQQQALCTYKDPDLPEATRYELAFEILGDGEDLATTTNQETLGLAGAIYKRKWQADAQKQNLEMALSYYLRGYEQGAANDQGYTGVNAAFVLDLLASVELRSSRRVGVDSAIAEARRAEARVIRQDLVDTLPDLPSRSDMAWLANEWWFFATVAEAYFGLGRYDDALEWLKKASALEKVAAWEFESTARQLADLARVQMAPDDVSIEDFQASEAGRVLQGFLGEDAPGVVSAFIGKVGLALSGGGFRASLFHIGVLARLAELGVLRHVEMLSCVSGGSIVGAHYYLEVRNLLQSKTDAEITDADYVGIVKRMERDFLAGVQKNIRTRVAAEFTTNLKMTFRPDYSRTQRAGDLYEQHIYSRIQDGEGSAPRWLGDLRVRPEGGASDFEPKGENWRRRHKVPMLILNATTLNTGHNWQFTASWMGESAASVDPEIDGNYRLRRVYYGDAPDPHKKVRLGTAVAASACVPGLFEPIVLEDLYPGKTVRLVDGGVHDNQGVVGLLEQDCDVLLVSDASGQMDTVDDPSSGMLGVPLRANGILMARVREAEYDDLVARRRGSLLRGFMFIHMKKGLNAASVPWVGCKEPQEDVDEASPEDLRGDVTRYDIRKAVQRRLAAVRTDLDSFSDAEAYALMVSGYRMTKFQFPRSIDSFAETDARPAKWNFLAIEDAMDRDPLPPRFDQLLDVAAQGAFKVWKMSPGLRILGLILAVLAAVGAAWLLWHFRCTSILSVGTIGILVGAAIAGAVLGKVLMRNLRIREVLLKITVGLGMSLLGFAAARLHLHVFDRLYLRWGRVDRVIR